VDICRNCKRWILLMLKQYVICYLPFIINSYALLKSITFCKHQWQAILFVYVDAYFVHYVDRWNLLLGSWLLLHNFYIH
jgi:hypothetical protein